MKEWEGRETAGFARGDKGSEPGYNLVSGNGKEDSELIDWVDKKLKAGGLTPGASTSTRNDDVEQKFVAIMYKAGMTKAEIVINHPGGLCKDARLDYLLGDMSLLVLQL
ncbi:DddA-like double-stranded DNA deaminase toxin [Kitasatospora sp. NPDC086801]|uniref:DddA-like double-stranded DNA deaminase toxin n=1 Tax=Kitasatospora sp. NPDC086801 TaxID=3364066 RepID=UPI00382AF302